MWAKQWRTWRTGWVSGWWSNDDRPEFCTPEAVPDADEYIPTRMSELPEQLEITPWTYLVLTTRGANVDVDGLPALLETPAAYIGVIGSQRRWATARKAAARDRVCRRKSSSGCARRSAWN